MVGGGVRVVRAYAYICHLHCSLRTRGREGVHFSKMFDGVFLGVGKTKKCYIVTLCELVVSIILDCLDF